MPLVFAVVQTYHTTESISVRMCAARLTTLSPSPLILIQLEFMLLDEVVIFADVSC